MKIELDSRTDGIGVRVGADSSAQFSEALASFKRAIAARGRRYDPAARQWVVRRSYYPWVMLWGAQARREFGASVEDRVKLRPSRPRPAPREISAV